MPKSFRVRSVVLLLALVMSTVTMLGIPAQAAGPKRVAVLPFTANAKDDISFLIKGIRDMLATRLAWKDKVVVIEPDLVSGAMKKVPPPYTDIKARQLGASMGADAVVFGSVTVLGKAVSLDARVVRSQGNQPALTAYVSTSDLDQVIPSISQFAQRINAEIFARPQAMAEAKRQEAQAEATASGQTMEAQSGGDGPLSKLPPNMSPLNPLFRRAISGVESDRFWRSPRINGNITSLAVADIDLDGKNELLVLLPNSLRIYRLAGKHFALVREFKGGPRGNYLYIDSADMDGDGRPEIYITNMNDQTLQSFILEVKGHGLAYRLKDVPYYFRIQPRPGSKGKMLLGQKAAVDSPFFGPVYELEFTGGQIKQMRKLKLPKLANVMNFTLIDVKGDGRPWYAVVDFGNHIRLYNTKRRRVWTSGGQYAASAKYVPYLPTTASDEGEDSWWFIPARMVPTDLDGDGKQEMLVVRNDDRMAGLAPRSQLFYQGVIYSLFWNGLSMAEAWRTPRISGYLTDYTIADVGNIGRPALVLSVGQRTKSGFFDKGSSFVVAFTLKPESIKPPHRLKQGL